MKKLSPKKWKLIGLAIAGVGAISYILLTTPSHNYEVDSALIVEPSSYESCIKASYGVIDDTNEIERKEDARACLDALDGKEFFVDVDGKALIFVSSNEYYRISPDVIEKFKVKASALLNDANILERTNNQQTGT